MHEVIVYRNPVQAYFWHMLQTGDGIGVVAAIITMAIFWLVIVVNIDKLYKRRMRLSSPVRVVVDKLNKYQYWIANLSTALLGWSMHVYFS